MSNRALFKRLNFDIKYSTIIEKRGDNMGNYDFGNGNNYRNNGNNNSNANNPNEYNRSYLKRSEGNSKKVTIIVFLSILIVLVIAVLAVLLLNGNFQSSQDPAVEQTVKTMYIDNDENIALWESPATSSVQIDTVPMGGAVEFVATAENGFAKVKYNGKEGFVESKFLSETEPYIWQYEDSEVEGFVEDVLYAFVSAVNTDNISLLTVHLDGQALTDAYQVHEQVTKVTNSETVLEVKCYGVTRISKTQVTVVRESKIRVYRHNGTVKDVSEKYLTTVENTGDGMKVIKFEAIE